MLSLKSGERLIQKPVFLKIFYLKLAIYLLLYILLLIPIFNRNETFYNFFKLKSAVGEYVDYEVSTIINWTFYSFLTMIVIYHRLMTNTRSFKKGSRLVFLGIFKKRKSNSLL